jgi:hypothetical protein
MNSGSKKSRRPKSPVKLLSLVRSYALLKGFVNSVQAVALMDLVGAGLPAM